MRGDEAVPFTRARAWRSGTRSGEAPTRANPVVPFGKPRSGCPESMAPAPGRHAGASALIFFGPGFRACPCAAPRN